MAKYRHQKGVITDNALKALLTDPLFRQRIEKNQKGKGSYQRREKYAKPRGWEAGDKGNHALFLSAAFFFLTVNLLATRNWIPSCAKSSLIDTI